MVWEVGSAARRELNLEQVWRGATGVEVPPNARSWERSNFQRPEPSFGS